MKYLIKDLKFIITASNDSEVDNKIEQLILDYIKQVEIEKQLLINGVGSCSFKKEDMLIAYCEGASKSTINDLETIITIGTMVDAENWLKKYLDK